MKLKELIVELNNYRLTIPYWQLALTLLLFGMTIILLISGCSLVSNFTKENNDEFNREKKRFEQHEPYVPSPRDFKKETE